MISLSLILRATLGIVIIIAAYGLALVVGLVFQVGIGFVWHSLLAFLFTLLHSQGFTAGVAFTVLVAGYLVLILLRALMEMR